MSIDNITQTISTIPMAGKRGVDVQTVFVNKQEAFQDALTDVFVGQINTLRTQLNTFAGQVNTTATQVDTNATTATTKASEASASATSASTSASKALTSRNQAETFAQQAQASASSVDANNIVHRTGDENIAGVKTFSSSPIVPTPTTGTQAVNKDYVDANAGEIITAGTGLQKTGTTLNLYPFELTTATTELTTSDYVVVSDGDVPKKISLTDLMVELGNTASFQSSKISNGYQKLPNGLIIQWGTASTNGTYSFPITFPNACLTLTWGRVSSANGIPGVDSFTTSKFVYRSLDIANVVGYYVAIGY